MLKITEIHEKPADESTEADEAPRTYSNSKLLRLYCRAGGSWFLLSFYLLILVLTQLSTSGIDYWLGYWTNVEEVRDLANYDSGNLQLSRMADSNITGSYEIKLNRTYF